MWRRMVVVFLGSGMSLFAAAEGRLLGPTGMQGTITGGIITVTAVEKGAPADGKIQKGDMITGLDGAPFKGDVVRAMAAAIDKAETEAAGGTLKLLLKDKASVELPLAVLGSYSATAPYDCPKSAKIAARLAEWLVKNPKLGSGCTKSCLLGLMATGEKKYQEAAFKVIRESDHFKPDAAAIDAFFNDGTDLGSVGWYWGYDLITLGEYYLLTKDASVLPAMRTYALGLARGQDAVGLWGHRMAKNGRLPGYAHMNQNSLSDFMGMLFAKTCGIDDPVLDQAIAKTYVYVEDHVGQGSFPYGVHGPQASRYNNNGTSGSAAFCMALKNNNEGTQFFSQLAATAFDGLEQGHASTFFNPLWTQLGANLSGPEVTQQFFEKSLWYHNLRRRWDGGYGDWGTEGADAGVALLIYCLPRKALVITGRDADQSIWVRGDKATEVVMRSKVDYDKKSTRELIALLGDPIPQVPYAALNALGKRKDKEIVPALMTLIESGTEQQRRHALSYFKVDGTPGELASHCSLLGTVLRDAKQPLAVRTAAASVLAFGPYKEMAHAYYIDVLNLLDAPRPDAPDPFGRADMEIAKAASQICGAPFEVGLAKGKEELIYRSALRFMDHKLQHVRAAGAGMLVGMPPEDFYRVADKMIYVLENKDPTYYTYHNAGSTSQPAIRVLASLGIKEGLDYMLDIAFNDKSKWGFRYRMIMDNLPLYGGNAKPYIPKFEAHPSINKPGDRFTPQWQKVVKAIEEDTNPKALRTLDEVRKAGAVQ